jgi:hypothetical protein
MAKAGEHLTVDCTHCGASYRQSRSDQMFCSGRCASAAWRSRKPKTRSTCPICRQDFAVMSSNQTYCSGACQGAANRSRRLRPGAPGKGWSKGVVTAPRDLCTVCGAEFYAPPVLKRRGGGRFCSNKCRGAYIATHPAMFPQTQTRRGLGGRRDDLGGLYVRSAWEANWARYLNWQVECRLIVSWEFEPETFEFPIKRGSRFYTPDFRVVLLDGTVEYHEVKGWMDQRSATKLKRMAKYHRAIKIVLIDKERYRAVAQTVGGLIPHWEGGSRK